MKKAMILMVCALILSGCSSKMTFQEMKDSCPVQVDTWEVSQPAGEYAWIDSIYRNETAKTITSVVYELVATVNGNTVSYTITTLDTIYGSGQIWVMVEIEEELPLTVLDDKSYVTDVVFADGTSWHSSDYWSE